MVSAHAILGPSSAERWSTCTASVTLIDSLPAAEEGPNTYAEEGTAAHGLGELKVLRHFGHITDAQYKVRHAAWVQEFAQFALDPEWLAECEEYMEGYLRFIIKEAGLYPGSVVLAEQRLFSGVEGVWGTSDVVILSVSHLGIVDLKYGAGIKVDAEANPQLRLYAAGAVNEFGDLLVDDDVVRYAVYQPRMNGHISVEETTIGELKDWLNGTIRPAAEAAITGVGAEFKPSVKACRWCAAAGACPTQRDFALEAAFGGIDMEETTDVTTMSPAELSEALEKVPLIKQWLNSLEAVALDTAYSEGIPLPGFKVVQSGGIRQVHDPAGAMEALTSRGWELDEIAPRKIKGIGDLTKMIGAGDFDKVLGDYVRKTSGRPSLVPESDKRPAINRNIDATAAFSEFIEEEE